MSEEIKADQVMRLEAMRLTLKYAADISEHVDVETANDLVLFAKEIYEFIKGEDK
jgi:hypothetical protein